MLSHEFSPGCCYLDTATYGLASAPVLAALGEFNEGWAAGTYDSRSCDGVIARAREIFARLHGVGAGDVAAAPQVSTLVATVAAGLGPGARVLSAEGDFTSLLFPFAAAGARLTAVPLERIADAIHAGIDAVAVSLVQSSDGRLADLDAIVAAAAAHGALTVVDATQACGWLPIDAARVDVLVCGGYKWLGHPRGTAFMVVRDEVLDRLVAVNANWYANDDPWTSIYGLPFRHASGARRFDVSPAWSCWHGAVAALELLESIGIARVHEHDVTLANRLRAGLDLPAGDSAIVSLAAGDSAAGALRAAGVRASVRAGRIRISPHLHNDEADVDRALEALRAVDVAA
jgi:selenocysteine lyase/cysteine desulfurase